MAAGDDVIFQATFFDGTWRGHADFLLRVDDPERPSVWGSWHYEVADTKLARHVKASAVLQICSYVDQLERVQGVRPEWMHVALGGSARAVERLRVDDFMAYYRSAKARFLATMTDEVAATYPPATTYPEPVEHCDVCRWAVECVARRRADDHLSLVAGISARQRRALIDRGDPTLEALGDLPLPMDPEARGHEQGSPAPRPGTGADPARRAPRRDPALRAPAARRAMTRSARNAVSPRCRRRRPATCSSISRATRTPSTTGSTTCSASSRSTARSTRSGLATRKASSASMANGARSRP